MRTKSGFSDPSGKYRRVSKARSPGDRPEIESGLIGEMTSVSKFGSRRGAGMPVCRTKRGPPPPETTGNFFTLVPPASVACISRFRPTNSRSSSAINVQTNGPVRERHAAARRWALADLGKPEALQALLKPRLVPNRSEVGINAHKGPEVVAGWELLRCLLEASGPSCWSRPFTSAL